MIKDKTITLSHGSGGKASWQLIHDVFMKAFHNPWLDQENDQALFQTEKGRMVTSVDSHVVSPLFFPGGDIGSLSVTGTINDIAMAGAKPLYLTIAAILEEGFPLKDLQQIVDSIAITAKAAHVAIVAGDTKVVERGKGDGIYLTTTGIGIVPDGINISGDKASPGDKIILSGHIGDHGIAIMSKRENLQFHTTLKSDCAALHDLVARMVEVVPSIHCLRDPTRGGLATTLNELALQSKVGFIIDENQIPIRPEVESACELLGLDPLYIANEGKLVAISPSDQTETLIHAMRKHPLGQNAQIIGEVITDPHHFVQLKTKFGGLRMMDWLVGEQLPRIC